MKKTIYLILSILVSFYLCFVFSNIDIAPTSTEVKFWQSMAIGTDKEKAESGVGILGVYYRIRGEKENEYLIKCHKKNLGLLDDDSASLNPKINLHNCPQKPIERLKNHRTFLDEIIAYAVKLCRRT